MPSTLVLTGSSLSVDDLVEAAQDASSQVVPSTGALRRMAKNRAFAERVARRGDEVYGLSTGVGVRKKTRIKPTLFVDFQTRMVREHATGTRICIKRSVVF